MIKRFFSKIGNKIVFFTGLSLLVLALLVTIPYTYITNESELKQIDDLEMMMKDNFDRVLRNEIETAISMLQLYADKIGSGELTEEQGMFMAADVLRNLRFGKDGYFWADTKEGVNVVMLGNAELEGKSRIHLKDANGTAYMRDIINNGIKGGGYSEYWFPRKGQTEAFPKRSYSKLFEPFGWVIGTGNYIDDVNTVVGAIRKQRQEELDRTISMVLGVSIVTVLLTLFFAFFMGRRISRPIVDLSGKTSLVAQGDLTVDIKAKLNDEVGVLGDSVAKMVEKIRAIVTEISESASNVVAASGQMSSASQVIADGASEQAASTEEISTSVQQMVASIMQNTQNAARTELISTHSAESMSNLKNAFRETLDAMQQIAAKSVIIKGISTQTNLLALNAAVEAARAGESGRGFGVVAGEVRKLSENTQRTAHDIDELTKGSLDIAEHAWSLLEKLMPEFEESNQLVKEIALASSEQRTGASQINSAVQQLVNVTSQNSASAEELASSAEELASQAENLKEAIGYFRV